MFKFFAKDLAEWVDETVRQLNVPLLSKYGLTVEQFDEVCQKSAESSSMAGNSLKARC
jgi:hypothetical protein